MKPIHKRRRSRAPLTLDSLYQRLSDIVEALTYEECRCAEENFDPPLPGSRVTCLPCEARELARDLRVASASLAVNKHFTRLDVVGTTGGKATVEGRR